jgi:circadian clock protein KaiB
MNKNLVFKFRQYVAGDTQNSLQAVVNLRALCQQHLPDRHEIEIVDVFEDPKRALADGIFMTPTLVKLTPVPLAKIVGTLTQTRTVLQVLGVQTVAP